MTRYFPYAEWIPFSANIALISIPFIFVGYWLSWSGIYTNIRNKPLLIKILVVFFLMIVPLLLYRFNLPPSVTEGFNHVELSIGACGNYLFFMVNAICGSMGIIGLATIADCTYLRKVGQSTLTCLGTHGIIISVVTITISKICDISWAIYIVYRHRKRHFGSLCSARGAGRGISIKSPLCEIFLWICALFCR